MNIFTFKPIGHVRNDVKKRSEITAYGVRSRIEILPEYEPAIDLLDENTHIMVFCCFHHGKRDILRVHPRKFNVYSMQEKGVLATRSPDRPNLISFTVVKLVRRTGSTLEVEGLDLIDGTPVLDLKPYVHETDAVFNTQRKIPSSSFHRTAEETLHLYLKKSVMNFIHAEDGSLDTAIGCFVKIIKRLDRIPDRTVVDHIETDFTGNALDCIYYFTKFTPGEDRIRSVAGESRNSFIRFYLKSGEWEEVRS